MYLIGIRLANYLEAGKGHLNRCINIREHFKHTVIWFLDKKEKKIKNLYPKDKIFIESGKSKVDKCMSQCKKKKISLILIDSYDIKKNTLEKLNKIVFTSIILDNYKKLYANVIISTQMFQSNRLDNVTYLTGTKFAPINYTNRENSTVRNALLVSMGMYDRKGITLKIVKVLKKHYKKKSINFDTIVTLGKKSPFLKQIKAEIKGYTNKINLKVDAESMSLIYEKCFFALGAPGISHLERLAYGVPSILIAQNNKHRLLVEKWNEKTALLVVKIILSGEVNLLDVK